MKCELGIPRLDELCYIVRCKTKHYSNYTLLCNRVCMAWSETNLFIIAMCRLCLSVSAVVTLIIMYDQGRI